MKKYIYFFSLFIIFSCSSKTEKKATITENKMYKQSEMAALMLKMYEANLENKELILQGKTPTNNSKDFFKIHTAKLTDSTDRNAAFKGYSDIYLKTYNDLFNKSEGALKTKHNNTINSCIACHKTTCLGPIPKIKKLLIP